jgi:hypothetical protein
MKFTNLDADQRKQLIEFYKAMKMASRMFAKGKTTSGVVQLADQIILELKKENPDEEKMKQLADQLQLMASSQV